VSKSVTAVPPFVSVTVRAPAGPSLQSKPELSS
jgi:hypothetical protein